MDTIVFLDVPIKKEAYEAIARFSKFAREKRYHNSLDKYVDMWIDMFDFSKLTREQLCEIVHHLHCRVPGYEYDAWDYTYWNVEHLIWDSFKYDDWWDDKEEKHWTKEMIMQHLTEYYNEFLKDKSNWRKNIDTIPFEQRKERDMKQFIKNMNSVSTTPTKKVVVRVEKDDGYWYDKEYFSFINREQANEFIKFMDDSRNGSISVGHQCESKVIPYNKKLKTIETNKMSWEEIYNCMWKI